MGWGEKVCLLVCFFTPKQDLTNSMLARMDISEKLINQSINQIDQFNKSLIKLIELRFAQFLGGYLLSSIRWEGGWVDREREEQLKSEQATLINFM